MKARAGFIALAALAALGSASAQNAVGYNAVTVPAGSDVLVSVPFNQKAEMEVAVDAKTVSGVTVSGLSMTTDEYKDMYYVRFIDGNGEGLWATITANGTDGFEFDTDVLAEVAAGDTFRVYPHHTLASVFPDGMLDVMFEASSNPSNRKTEIIIPGVTSTGINKSGSATYYYYNNQWLKIGAGSTNYDNTVLSPESYIVVRNKGSEALTYIASGDVEPLALGRFVAVETAKNDVAAVSGRPVPVTLAQLGLGGTAAFETSVNPANRKDELLVFDNSTTGYNKSASATYYYYNGQWRKIGGGLTNYDDQLLDAGAALIIRKAAAASAGTAQWNQSSPF